MNFFLSSIYFLTMLLVNLVVLLKYGVLNLKYLYFHQTLVISNFVLLIANLYMVSIKCDHPSKIFFRKIYKILVIITFCSQLFIVADLWYQYPKYTLPFFKHFWQMPESFPFSILVARITSCLYLLSPVILLLSLYFQSRANNLSKSDNNLVSENPLVSSDISLMI